MKNAVNQQVFRILSIFSPTCSVITPSFYMLVNIDTRGYNKAPDSQNIAVGSKPQCTKNKNPTKIYQKELYYRLEIWHQILTHKIKTR